MTIAQSFQTLTGFPPRQFQLQTIHKLLNRQDVLLRAPTGSGKTETAIAPFLFAKTLQCDFPNKLIYVVPLRTLANSLRQRAETLARTWEAIASSWRSLARFLQDTLPLESANLSREFYAVTREFDLNRFDMTQMEYLQSFPSAMLAPMLSAERTSCLPTVSLAK